MDNEENLEPEVKPEPETVSKVSKEYLGKLQYKVSKDKERPLTFFHSCSQKVICVQESVNGKFEASEDL